MNDPLPGRSSWIDVGRRTRNDQQVTARTHELGSVSYRLDALPWVRQDVQHEDVCNQVVLTLRVRGMTETRVRVPAVSVQSCISIVSNVGAASTAVVEDAGDAERGCENVDDCAGERR
jgi:hypothetical protein